MLHGHTEWSGRWSITTGILEARRDVADGVLFDLSLWATSTIGLAVQCPGGKYFGLIRVPTNVYNQVLEFLKRNRGRKLREVKDGDVDISDVNSVGPVAKYSNSPVRSVMAIWESWSPNGGQVQAINWLSACAGMVPSHAATQLSHLFQSSLAESNLILPFSKMIRSLALQHSQVVIFAGFFLWHTHCARGKSMNKNDLSIHSTYSPSDEVSTGCSEFNRSKSSRRKRNSPYSATGGESSRKVVVRDHLSSKPSCFFCSGCSGLSPVWRQRAGDSRLETRSCTRGWGAGKGRSVLCEEFVFARGEARSLARRLGRVTRRGLRD